MSAPALPGPVDALGVPLYTEVEGSGPPLLVLHGGGCTLDHLKPLAASLADGTFQRIAFERPGHGRSPDVPGDFDYDRGVAESLAVLDALGVTAPVTVLGFSDGAIIGLLLALHHPSRVRALVAISGNLDPTAFTPETTAAASPDASPSPTSDAAPGDGTAPDPWAPTTTEPTDPVFAKLIRLWTTEPHIDPASLEAVTAPVLVMSGDRDSIRVDHSTLIAASLPHGRLSIIPGTTHSLTDEKPALVAATIDDFLSSLPN